MEENNLIFGIRAVMEALKAGKEIDKILIKKDLQGELAQELFAAVKGTNIFIQRVPIEKINRITRKNHQGVIAFISSVTCGSKISCLRFMKREKYLLSFCSTALPMFVISAP